MVAEHFLVPVAASRRSSSIVQQILPMIRDGRLKPGDRFPPERELAETLGVSRSTIRDAFRALEVLGLVDIRVGAAGGAFVTTPSTEVLGESALNLFAVHGVSDEERVEARVVFELAILDLALERADESDLAGLQELCVQAREAAESGSYDRSLSLRFHARLAASAHNAALSLAAQAFSGPLSMAPLDGPDLDSRAAYLRLVREHEELTDAIARRDRAAAHAILRHHLERDRLADPADAAETGGGSADADPALLPTGSSGADAT